MKSTTILLAGLSAVLFSFAPTVPLQGGELSPSMIQPMLAGLGYEPKAAGSGLWEITLSKDGLDVPVAIGLSSSGRKLWITVFLGELDARAKANSDRLLKLLKRNYEIQPTHFFISSQESSPPGNPQDVLKIGMALDNRGIGSTVLRREIEKLVDDVVSSRKLWEKE